VANFALSARSHHARHASKLTDGVVLAALLAADPQVVVAGREEDVREARREAAQHLPGLSVFESKSM